MISSKPIPQVFKDAERVRVKAKFESLAHDLPPLERCPEIDRGGFQAVHNGPRAVPTSEDDRFAHLRSPLTVSDLLRQQNAERAVGIAKAVGEGR